MSDAQAADASPLEQVKSAFSAPRESASAAASDAGAKVQRRNSRFKVVASRESSLLPSVGHPRGWANKAPSPVEDEEVDAPWKSHACVMSFFFFLGGTDEGRLDGFRFNFAAAPAETHDNQRTQTAVTSTGNLSPAAAHTNGANGTSTPTRA